MSVNLSSLLKDGVVMSLPDISSRKQAIAELAVALSDRLRESAEISCDAREIQKKVLERERSGSTGVGDGVAIPHARLEEITFPVGAFLRLSGEGVDFDAVDNSPCNLIFMILAPESSHADHLRALAQVSRAFRQKTLREKLLKAQSEQELMDILCGSLTEQTSE